MSKQKQKNIDYISSELKNKFNGISSNTLKIGVVTCVDNFEKQSYALTLAELVKSEVTKTAECEIVVLPSINERFRVFSESNYALNSYKKQITNFLELVLSEKNFDGLVFIPSGFQSTVGLLLSAIRLNLPVLFLSQGISQTRVGFNLNDLLFFAGKIARAEASIFDFEERAKKFCEFSGTGISFSSENIFNCLLEVMELSTKNNATLHSHTFEKETQAKETANLIVNLSKNHLPLKKMINKKSLLNAIMLNFGLGGSPYIIDALCDISKEAELDFDLTKILNLSKNVPVFFDPSLNVDKFEQFGGVWALLKTMIKNKNIDGSYKTLDEITLLDETKKVLKSFFAPIKNESLIVLRGNIAEKGALVKTLNVAENKILTKVQVFSSDMEACNAVMNKAIDKNCAIIIKDNGKKSDTGLGIVSQTAFALESMDLEKNHIIITDGFVVDDTKAVCVCGVLPDSTGGNLRYLKDGDEIEIDFLKGKINANVTSKEFLKRQKKYIKETKILPKYLLKN